MAIAGFQILFRKWRQVLGDIEKTGGLKGLPWVFRRRNRVLLHACNEKTIYLTEFLEIARSSGAIRPTSANGGWLRVSKGNPASLIRALVKTLEKLAMKKSLIALAALAATASFAQSSVTISGHMDFAGASVGGTQAIAKGSTVSTTVGTSSTSVLRFIAVEDLGGGMRATAQYNFDPRTIANDSTAVTLNTVGTAGASNTIGNTTTGLARDEVFIGLSGGFGNIRLGSPNSIGLGSHGVSSPLGTGIGSGYTGGGTAATMTNSYVNTRYNRSVRYDSPAVNGFTVAVLYAPGNDQPAVAAATTTSGGQSALLIPNARQATEIGINYSTGPLNISYANVALAAQTTAGGWYAVGSNVAGVKTSVNMVNANYKVGATTLYAGWNDGDALISSTSATTATKGSRFAVKHDVGALSLIAQYTEQKSGTANTKATVTGLRADYALSKRSAAYAGYEEWDTGTAYNNSLTTGTRKITSVGLRHSF